VAFDMGLEGKPDVAWRALSRRVAEITGEKIHEAWFAPSGRGAHFREHIEASFADGVAEREKRIDAVASELSDIVEEVVGATNGNGNGHHLEDGPTEEDLSLVEEVAKLETAIEEYQDRIRALEAQLAASAPAQVQTPQQDDQSTLEGILAVLETQLEASSLKAEAAAKAVKDAEEQAELAELEVDQARQRLQAAMEAVQTLQSLKEGE
jgi:chromosome segregation ATPase